MVRMKLKSGWLFGSLKFWAHDCFAPDSQGRLWCSETKVFAGDDVRSQANILGKNVLYLLEHAPDDESITERRPSR